MKAKIGSKYEIESDSHCYTLYKVGVAGEKAKNTGEKTRKVIGYYSDIDALIRMFPNRALLSSGAESLKEAVAEVRGLADELKEAMGVQT